MKLSKGKNLKYDELTMQPYLYSDKLTTKQAKFLMKIRFRVLEVWPGVTGGIRRCAPAMSFAFCTSFAPDRILIGCNRFRGL